MTPGQIILSVIFGISVLACAEAFTRRKQAGKPLAKRFKGRKPPGFVPGMSETIALKLEAALGLTPTTNPPNTRPI